MAMSAGTRQAYEDQGDPAMQDFYYNALANGQLLQFAKEWEDMHKDTSNAPMTIDQIFSIMDKMFGKYGSRSMPMFSGKQQQADLSRRFDRASQILLGLSPLLRGFNGSGSGSGSGYPPGFNPQWIVGGGKYTGGQTPNVGSIGTIWNGLREDIKNPTTFIPGAIPGTTPGPHMGVEKDSTGQPQVYIYDYIL